MPSPTLGIVRSHISPDLLFSAFIFAEMSHEIEFLKEPPDDLILKKHQSFVIAAVLSSVAFLEATINELYYVASDKLLEVKRMPEEYRERLSAMWAVENFRNGAKILEKYQIALKLLGKEQFDKAYDPYKSVKLVVDLRNALVHYKPKTNFIRFDPDEREMSDLEKKLKDKFKTNPFVPKFPVFPSNHPERRADYPFFPGRCLGYGCAKWSAIKSLFFADDFFTRINVRWHYHQISGKLPKLP